MHDFKKADYRVLFECSADAMLIIDGNQFVDFNDATLRMLGYPSREALFAKHPSDLSPPEQPDGRSSFEKAEEMMACAFEKGSHRFEWMHQRANGDVFPVAVLLTVIPFEGREIIHTTWQDISERKRDEEKLNLSWYVMNTTHEGIVVTNTKGQIVEINPAFSKIMGYSRDEVLGRNPRMTRSGKHDATFYEVMWDSIKRTGNWSGEIWDRHKNGGLILKRLRINTIPDRNGNPLYYIGFFKDITEAKRTEKKLEGMAYSDPLTELPNRYLFHQHLNQQFLSAKRHKKRFAVLFIDLDRFKWVNDTYGHLVGDTLLVEVSKRIRASVRASDLVARLGGDEFTVLVSDVNDMKGALSVADKVTRGLRQPLEIEGHDIPTGASVGVAFYPDHGHDGDALMRHADLAMYQAKKNTDHGYCVFSPGTENTTA